MSEFKSGYVGIVGRPNVGKSTLLNAMLGQKISIISAKPQTTRSKILAIMTEENSQVVFLDTPGFHTPRTKLGENMIKAINATIDEVDMLLMVVEPKDEISPSEQQILEKIGDIPAILVINKIDTVKKEELLSVVQAYSQAHNFKEVDFVSAKSGSGLGLLKKLIHQNIPEGPMYYPEDMITDQQERQIVAEIIREKMLHLLDKEVPHGITIERVKMKQRSQISNDLKWDLSSYIASDNDIEETFKIVPPPSSISCAKT